MYHRHCIVLALTYVLVSHPVHRTKCNNRIELIKPQIHETIRAVPTSLFAVVWKSTRILSRFTQIYLFSKFNIRIWLHYPNLEVVKRKTRYQTANNNNHLAHLFRMFSPYCVSAASIIVSTARIPFSLRLGQPECTALERVQPFNYTIFHFRASWPEPQSRWEINFHSKGKLKWAHKPTSHQSSFFNLFFFFSCSRTIRLGCRRRARNYYYYYCSQ